MEKYSSKKARERGAFSLVEILMALLVASLLMVSLAPVMTKRLQDNYTIKGGEIVGAKNKKHEITFGSPECNNIVTEADGTQYCEGEFVVPTGFNGNMKITLIGAGGGGGGAATAGYSEWKTHGNYNFTTPIGASEVEVTLVSGGGGGGAGGQIEKNQVFVAEKSSGIKSATNQTITENSSAFGTWTLSSAIKGKYVKVVGCGGGGGGGSTAGNNWGGDGNGYGGGSGAYQTKIFTMPNADKVSYFIGGGGGGGYIRPRFGSAAYTRTPTKIGGGNGGADDLDSNTDTILGGYILAHYTSSTTSPTYLNNINGRPTGTGGAGGIGNPSSGEYPWGWSTNGLLIGHANGGNGGLQGGGSGNAPSWDCINGTSSGGGGGATLITSALTSASDLKNTTTVYYNAGGGGGGASKLFGPGYVADWSTGSLKCVSAPAEIKSGVWAGGGGGGGATGGKGGGSTEGPTAGTGGDGGVSGNGSTGGTTTTIFGSNYCDGGNGGYRTSSVTDQDYGHTGKQGAISITYVDYGPGGSGGGAAFIVPAQTYKVAPKTTLNIIVGEGAEGGTNGSMEADGNIKNASNGKGYESSSNVPYQTKISVDGVLKYIAAVSTTRQGWTSGTGGCQNGVSSYYLTSTSFGQNRCSMGSRTVPGNVGGQDSFIHVAGFAPGSDTDPLGYGYSAGNLDRNKSGTYDTVHTGGDGGVTKLFGKIFCTPGKGGQTAGSNGTAASGYGCGGGGGYSLANGGKGGDGYARISWNKKYIVGTEEEYELNQYGSGGGGASGNVLKYTVNVSSGQHIKIRIGKGGTGGQWTPTGYINATNGGNTEFDVGGTYKLKAGGGSRGYFPMTGGELTTAILNSTVITAANTATSTLSHGAGGKASTLCSAKGKDEFATTGACKQGEDGYDASYNETSKISSGGKGGTLPSVSIENILRYLGAGGDGTAAGGGTRNGGNASGYGSGGGGAGLLDLGLVNTSADTGSKGGDGSHGIIIITWTEE